MFRPVVCLVALSLVDCAHVSMRGCVGGTLLSQPLYACQEVSIRPLAMPFAVAR